MFKIKKQQIIIALVIIIIAVYFNKYILEAIGYAKENFRQGRNFFWGFNEPTRNMTYDTRHDRDVRNKYTPKETGVFYESGLYKNFQD